MMKTKILRGLPVISLEDGRLLGKVQELVIDPQERRVVALVTGEKGLLRTRAQVIPFDRLRSIGTDAVTVTREGEVQELRSRPDLEKLLELPLLGGYVISEEGTKIGRVEDFSFNPTSGQLHGLLLQEGKGDVAEGFLPIDEILYFGEDYIIARRDAATKVRPAEGGEEETAEKPVYRCAEGVLNRARDFTRSLEVKAIDFAIDREAGQTITAPDGSVIIEKGQKVTHEIIDRARQENRLYHVLFAAGVGELLEGLDFTRERLDSGSRRLLEAWQAFKERSYTFFRREEMETPDGWEDRLAGLEKRISDIEEKFDQLIDYLQKEK